MKKSTDVTYDSSYGVSDWRALFKPERAPAPQRSEEIDKYFQSLWPAADSYASALNPIFLLDLLTTSKWSADECWLVRDGLIPLLWFFTNNPIPGRFQGRLRIHADFEAYVPAAWRPQTELYELFADENALTPGATEVEPGSEILLTGLAVPPICSLSHLEAELREIVNFVGGRERLAQMKIFAYLPIRYTSADHLGGAAFHQIFFKTLFQEFGLDIAFFEYEGFQWMHSSPKIWFHEFNQKLLYADSLLTLQSLSRGHRPLLGPRRSRMTDGDRYAKILPIFPHVSCGLRSQFTSEPVNYTSTQWVSETQDRAKTLYLATSSPANLAYPWPKWFPAWCLEVASAPDDRS